MIEELVQTGLARFEYRHFPLGAVSFLPAMAMECAADQSGAAFWQFHDEFMRHDTDIRGSRDLIVEFARQIELDVDTFTQCFDAGTHLEQIQQRQLDAWDLAVRGTPTIHVNDENAGQHPALIRSQVEAAAQ